MSIKAALSKNISHDTSSGKCLLLRSLSASGIQRSFASYWKLNCLGFTFSTLKTIAVAVHFTANSWQSQDIGNKEDFRNIDFHPHQHYYSRHQIDSVYLPVLLEVRQNSSVSQGGGLGCGFKQPKQATEARMSFEAVTLHGGAVLPQQC